ncbi:bacteriocin immunity protein [Lactiplantibacillus paraplantarum]|uniref:bacteriocin immunity protein n=1 Tax=Lactiplantibacillus paraplantarum TaxID=60520 RepID=UPI000512C221|nr:bacteriocin immunity protein [Lactiplantibacillus paraplantarum]OAX75575.1 bacteriocin immunity protein [Lactiplantibacillus plantarum]ALO05227.1 bacteriocin immunity protein [Lactiplantibacillus paraplantarum]KGE75658.1 bacteriocin immunity protein [Lactiplantibacillus paraplantarum]MCW1911456.1 bacteriocin immunity protein [Lactiplantibacillus paraplantarum]RDG12438.1 bacteriocin immunity protein [Lactiplantibacillus paraplantarum]
MDMDAQKLFTLVDAAYNQPITNQPSDSYRQALLAAAIDLNNNVSPQQVTIKLYQAYYRNYMVPMTLPRQHRDLYQYVQTQLQRFTRTEQRNMALGYGLIATHLTFGPLN